MIMGVIYRHGTEDREQSCAPFSSSILPYQANYVGPSGTQNIIRNSTQPNVTQAMKLMCAGLPLLITISNSK